ncbi:hypothetical protein [Streptomyces coelicoflavus]|uniref:hypothetical protein n=1 Tax=Streptomyces coelicoflavus TaxID=285562 RepID=UPI0030B8C2AA
MPDQPQVKYPFEFDGQWVLRYHVPYTVQHEGLAHRIVATVFAQPSVHGRIQVSCEGLPPVEYDGLTAGDIVEITGDTWRVAEVDYRTRVVLQRADDALNDLNDAVEEEPRVQSGE